MSSLTIWLIPRFNYYYILELTVVFACSIANFGCNSHTQIPIVSSLLPNFWSQELYRQTRKTYLSVHISHFKLITSYFSWQLKFYCSLWFHIFHVKSLVRYEMGNIIFPNFWYHCILTKISALSTTNVIRKSQKFPVQEILFLFEPEERGNLKKDFLQRKLSWCCVSRHIWIPISHTSKMQRCINGLIRVISNE